MRTRDYFVSPSPASPSPSPSTSSANARSSRSCSAESPVWRADSNCDSTSRFCCGPHTSGGLFRTYSAHRSTAASPSRRVCSRRSANESSGSESGTLLGHPRVTVAVGPSTTLTAPSPPRPAPARRRPTRTRSSTRPPADADRVGTRRLRRVCRRRCDGAGDAPRPRRVVDAGGEVALGDAGVDFGDAESMAPTRSRPSARTTAAATVSPRRQLRYGRTASQHRRQLCE